jgi:uncharacterized protein YhbP (UPF0306 family)
MNNDEIETVIREYITKVPHMSLATVSNSNPWVCEVHFAYDSGLNLYFVSLMTTRHAQEIALNPNVSGSIVRQHALTEAPSGIYFEGQAERLEIVTQEDIQRYATILNRDVEQVTDKLTAVDGKPISAMYKVNVTNWAAFGNFDGNGHRKHELNWEKI